FLRVALFSFTHAYQLNCPSVPHWKIRGNILCNSSFLYTCLFNTNTEKYNERCGIRRNVLGPGYHFVISGMLERRACGTDTFQPFPLHSNFSSRCVMRKSHCNGEGQVAYSTGTTTQDMSCRCNYNIKFAFVSKPKSKCFCVPSQ
ncbi:Hypothetical predicted protein, partial [Mytilus galloprovincialis]